MLTAKQTQFCRNIVAGMTGKDAYKAAYNTNASDQVLRNESNKLLQRDDITEKIKELEKPLHNHVINTVISEREKKRNILWQFINDTNKSDSDRLKALDLLNKMDAEYINVTKDITEEKTNIETLDNDTLFKLVN